MSRRYTNPQALTWSERRAVGLGRTPRHFGELCFCFCYHVAGQTITLASVGQHEQCVAAACRCPCHQPSVPHVFSYAEWEELLKVRDRARTLVYRDERHERQDREAQ